MTLAPKAAFDILTAAEYNEIIQALTPGWTDYVPVWTASGGGAVLGTGGSLTGRYRRSGGSDTVLAEIYMVLGSTYNGGTGFWSWTLPFNATARSIQSSSGTAYYYDTGNVPTRSGTARLNGANQLICDSPTLGFINATVPHTWGNTDVLSVQIEYQPV